MSETVAAKPEGSWAPLIVLSIVAFLCWISFSQAGAAVRLRRWYNMQVRAFPRLLFLLLQLTNKHYDANHCLQLLYSQKVQWKKKLGLRDESKYRDGAAGDGANQRHKRQG
jgi:hypothetical protein